MSSREVLTFQLGNYPNYVGAHWWNIQETYFHSDNNQPSEICHDVLFREGKTLKGQVTFTPRLVLVDNAENMSNVPTLDELVPTSARNSQAVVLQEQPEKHEFIKDLEKMEKGERVNMNQKDYKFEETVRTWSDYLRTRYHSRSVCSFPRHTETNIFHSGFEVFDYVKEDLTEKVRGYMEECDNLQGFQVVVDPTDGFGGLGDCLLLHLQDEYPNKTVITFPVISANSIDCGPLADVRRTLNVMLSYQKLTENSSLVVPLGTMKNAWRRIGPPTVFPNIIYSPDKPYHTSAILASFLDTATLKYRLREEGHMNDVVSGLSYFNKKVCAATMSLPFPIAPGSYLLDTLENLEEALPLWSQLTPGCNISNETVIYQRVSVRGIPTSRLRDPNIRQSNSRAYLVQSVEELVLMYLSYRQTGISDVKAVPIPLKTGLPFPKIFSPHVSPTGNVDENSTRMPGHEVSCCPVITGLHCSKAVGLMLDSLHQSVKTINIKKFHQFLGSHMDIDEFNECLEKLLSMGYGCASSVELR